MTPVSKIEQDFRLHRAAALAAQPTALSQLSYNAIMHKRLIPDLFSAGCYRTEGSRANQNSNVAIDCNVNDSRPIDSLGSGAGFGADAYNANTQPDERYHDHDNPMAMFGDNPGADKFGIFGSYFGNAAGCGKCTLLRIIAGLGYIASGMLTTDGDLVGNMTAADLGLSILFQSYALHPHAIVSKNLAFGLESAKMPSCAIYAKVREVTALLQITDYVDQNPNALSGGQRQRVAIGHDLKSLFFVEPLSNLGVEQRLTMRKELAALRPKLGGPMIYVTHEAARSEDRAGWQAARVVHYASGPVRGWI